MKGHVPLKIAFGVLGLAGVASVSFAQTVGPVSIPPPQVIPVYPELGTVVIVTNPQPAPPPLQSGGPGGGEISGGGTPGTASAMTAYVASGYSTSGIAAAQQVGINSQAMAGIALVESHDENVPDSNGSTSAFGVYQITQSTWQSTVAQNNLPFTLADMSNPADQAVVAAYIIRSSAQSVGAAINETPTVVQTYGAYVYGPGPGDAIAKAPPTEPLSQIVPAQELANNGMQNWTVGQFYSTMASRFGGTANDPVYS